MSDTQVENAGPKPATNAEGKMVGVRQGIVESDSRDKTRRVVIAYKAPHAKYGKFISRRTILHVHDENNESNKGDRVEIAPCRPVSKTKTWCLVRVVDKGIGT